MRFPQLPVNSHQGATLNFEKLQKALATPWLPASLLGFEHSWVNYEAGKRLPEYRKRFDIVELRGLIKGGESGKTAFTLPVGFRPKENRIWPTDANGVISLVAVTSGGGVEPIDVVAGSTKEYTYLDPARFSTE